MTNGNDYKVTMTTADEISTENNYDTDLNVPCQLSLKDAFRMQNKMKELISDLGYYLVDPRNYVTSTETHNRSASNPEANDEVIVDTSYRKYDVPAERLVSLYLKLNYEYCRLAKVISKKKCHIGAYEDGDIDYFVNTNTSNRTIAKMLKRISATKVGKTTKHGTGYKFNADGVQQPYVYDIVDESSMDVNRRAVANLASKLMNDADRISTKVDKLLLDTMISYTPVIDMNDTLDDIVEKMCSDEAYANADWKLNIA